MLNIEPLTKLFLINLQADHVLQLKLCFKDSLKFSKIIHFALFELLNRSILESFFVVVNVINRKPLLTFTNCFIMI